MLLEMLKCSLVTVKVDETIKAEEVYQMFDSVQMHILKENIEKKLTYTLEARKTQQFNMPIEADERISECFEFDLGHYPLTPWLNKSDDPLLRDLKRYNFFLPPKANKDELFIVSMGECSPLYEFHPL